MGPLEKSRIVCLVPSATDICKALDLTNYVVGITHECTLDKAHPAVVVTSCGLSQEGQQTEISQAAIHQMVQQAAASTLPSTSLYPINKMLFKQANATLILTQDLCGVCAPSASTVRKLLDGDETSATVVSLTPHSLTDVWENIITVARACGVTERGQQWKQRCEQQCLQLEAAIVENATHTPTATLLEWLDPPFDGGHWIPEMMKWVRVKPAMSKTGHKSEVISWDDLNTAQPDVVWIACCGFGLDRNTRDAWTYRSHLKGVAKVVFATDADNYFAKPGPQLQVGMFIMALTAYHNQPAVLKAIRKIEGCPQNEQVLCRKMNLEENAKNFEPNVTDIEDWNTLHDLACERGEHSYPDPATGYSVFTAVAHKKRGVCCGSGCRHCPYDHENVKDKASKIQQPAMLCALDPRHSVFKASSTIYVLFFSGGKDSFLTLRALVRKSRRAKEHFQVVLLTTFDSTSRIIAHQNVSIEKVIRQAKHLGLPLIGIPVNRGSKEPYVARIRRGLLVVEQKLQGRIDALIFGDLHLEHIRGWRDDQMGQLGYKLLYPLWKTSYEKLEADLERSCAPCIISGSTVESIEVGQKYDKSFREQLKKDHPEIDLFGENGEFHSLIAVWEVSRDVLLG